MIRLFDRNESNFNHNNCILNPLSCYVIEEANGMFEVEIELHKNVDIANGNIIKVPTPRGEQLFRVYRCNKTLKGKKAYARHIFYDLSNNFLLNVNLDNISAYTALQEVLSNTETQHKFIGNTDITSLSTVSYKRINPIQAIIGVDNSILNTWGGNLIRDNFNINIKANSIDRGYEIQMGKNLLGIEDDSDESSVKTRLYPIVENNGEIIMLPEKYVDSPYINNYGNPIIYEEKITLTDEQKELDNEEIYSIMRDHCNELYNTYNIDKPIVNYKIDFVELSKTEQYKHLAILEQLDLYDIVTCKVSHLNINVQAKVIKYKYDCLKERYDGIELGDFKASTNYKSEGIVKQMSEKFKTTESAVDYATNVITGNRGGFVVSRRYPNGKPYEILIMDTEDINTAKNLLRMNNSGLGFSQNGYNGSYGTAMTIDGHIVADYIDTGILKSILIQSDNYVANISGTKINLVDGTIDSKYFKLTPTKATFSGELQAATGTFKGSLSAATGSFTGEITGGSINIGNGQFLVDSFGNLTANGAKFKDGTFTGTITGSTISGTTFSNTDGSNTEMATIKNGVFTGTSFKSYEFSDVAVGTLMGMKSAVMKAGFMSIGDGALMTIISGSTMYTGNITCSKINDGTPINSINIGSQSVANAQYLRNTVYVSANNNLRPTSSGMSSCGTSDGLWTSIWASSGEINTSDARKKNSIQDLDSRYEVLFDNLMPRMYKMNDGTSDRFHTGLVSQETEQALDIAGISTQEFAGLVKEPIYEKRTEDGEYDTNSAVVDYDYFLRYNEFIPLLINKVKIQQKTIDKQSSKIIELEGRISKLEVA